MIHFEVDERWVHHIRQHPPHLCEYLWLWVFELWGARTSENLVSHLACGNLLAQEARKNPYRETNPHAARGRQIERGRVPNIRSWNLAMGVGMDGLWAEVVGPFFFGHSSYHDVVKCKGKEATLKIAPCQWIYNA